MTVLHRIMSIGRWLLARDRAERQLDDELRTYVEMSAAAKMRDGVPAAEARRLAMLELGGIEQAKERVRTSRHGAWIDEIGRDVRYACRVFGRNPGFASVVVLTLALGIGANTAIFSLIDALMLRWLPVRDPQQLVQVTFALADDPDPGESFSWVIVRAFAAQKQIFSGVTGFSSSAVDVGPPGSIVRVPGALVTGEFYETLGLTPQIGRLIQPADDERGAPLVAVISDGYWERQFARDPSVVGQTLLAHGLPVTIIGVSPRGFVGANVGTVADVTLPVAALERVIPDAAPLLHSGNFWLRVLARPRSGMSIAEASDRLNAAWREIAEPVIPAHWPPTQRKEFAAAAFALVPGGTGWTYLRAMYVKPLFVLMGVVVVVLLIACANVASLLLARASARQREIAVRLAIGAGRGRIVRQLLIESTLLSVSGAALGVALAWFSGGFLVRLIATGPNDVVFDLTPNGRVLGFSIAAALATAALFGIAPALQTTAVGTAAALKEGARMSPPRSRLLPSLVSAQVALTLVLLVGAGLFARTLHNLRRHDPGFNPAGVLLVDFEGRRTTVPPELLGAVQRIPGVVSASLSTHTPLSGSIWSEPAVPAGQTLPERDTAFFVGAGPGFFETMNVALLAGRGFTLRDSAAAPGVAIVNEQFAQRYFPGQNVVGQRLAAKVRGVQRDLEVIGLAKNTSTAGLRADPPRTVYVSYAQLTGDFPTTLAIRAAPDAAVAGEVRRVLQSMLPTALIDVRSLSSQVEATMVRERMMATLASAFGALALLLACVGLYGLLAYTVARRTIEIGIRMALGAQRQLVIALVLKGAARLVVAGIAVGLPAAWAASRAVESMLFGLSAADPVALLGAIVLLASAAQLAAYLPAWRASRVDPLTALRHE